MIEEEQIISFNCFNKKKNIEEIHSFPLSDWNSHIQKIDSKHSIICMECNRVIDKNEYVKNGLFEYKIGDKIIERVNYVNGLLDGLYERFYVNGNYYEKTYYKNGLLDGSCDFWYDTTGKKMKSMTYKNNKLHGLYKYYDQDGIIKENFVFNDGIRSDVIIKMPSVILNQTKKEENNNNEIKEDKKEEDKKEENILDDDYFDLSKKKKKSKKEKKNKYDSNSDSD